MKTELRKSCSFPIKASVLLLLVFGLLLFALSSATTYIFKPEPPELFFVMSFYEILMMTGVMIYFELRRIIGKSLSKTKNKAIKIIVPDATMISLLIATGMSLHIGYHVINRMMAYWDVFDFFSTTSIFVFFFAAVLFFFCIVSAVDHFINKLNLFMKTISITILAFFICLLFIASCKMTRCPFFTEGFLINDILCFFAFSFCFCIGISRFVILKSCFDRAIVAREKKKPNKLKPIAFTKHAYRYLERRGFTTKEVEAAIRLEEWQAADFGRLECRKEFAFNDEWNESFYATKLVRPIFVDEPNEIVVITVYTYYY